jgi:protease-4
VLAERSTITGSIGVIGGKLDLSALYRRIGIGLDAVERGARAGMHSSARGFTAEEREALTVEMRDLYAVFVARVAEGRRLPTDAVQRAAEGRIWSGRRALELGLVDAIGGPLEALQEARRRAGVRRGEPALLEVHPRRPPVSLRDLARWVS